jgi:hypothetical protein
VFFAPGVKSLVEAFIAAAFKQLLKKLPSAIIVKRFKQISPLM